jgi:hypothetical protein
VRIIIGHDMIAGSPNHWLNVSLNIPAQVNARSMGDNRFSGSPPRADSVSDVQLGLKSICPPRAGVNRGAMDIDGLTYTLEFPGNVEELGRAWTDLESRSDCSFFLTWDWIGTWLTTTPNLSPLLLSVRDRTEIVGLALLQPVRLRRNFIYAEGLLLHQTGNQTTDIITIEYNGFLCDRKHAALIRRSIFRFLTQTDTRLRNWNEIHIALATDSISQDAKREGLIGFELARKPSWFVDFEAVRSGGKPYLETIGRNTRYQIRRAAKLYERHGPVIANSARTRKEAAAYFEELKLYHQATWTGRGKAGSFANPYFEGFHRTLIEKCLEREAVELVRVTAGRKLVGLLYNFIHRGHVYAYQTGLCYKNDQRLKPGLVSHYVCIERHLQAGALIYDFMAGDSRYKANLGIPGPDLVHHVFKRPSIVARGEFFLRGVKAKLLERSLHPTGAKPDD